MTDFITIQAESILLQGTTHPPLCSTFEKYQKLTMSDIERQAYGSWMDGAR